MNDDNVRRLIADYPRLFGSSTPSWSDLPDGWYKLVQDLCTEIERLLPPDCIDNFRITQIKEKFGTLRFYYQGQYTDEVEAAIDAAEARSATICQDCGEPGKLRTGSWYRTLCDFCQKELEIRLARKSP